MPELAQLFLVDAAGRAPAEIRDALLRHRAFTVAVAKELGGVAGALARHDLRVERLPASALADAVWDVAGARAIVAADAATLDRVRETAAARGLPVVEI